MLFFFAALAAIVGFLLAAPWDFLIPTYEYDPVMV